MFARILFIGAFIFTAPLTVYAAENAGFVDGIWFSHDPVTDFAATDIFTIVHNDSEAQLQGIVTLFIDGTAVGARELSLGRGDIKKVTFSYEFSEGEYELATRFISSGGVEVGQGALAAKRIRVVVDTDGDGIPNSVDTDDDNDGILDTNDPQPLVAQASPPAQARLSAFAQNVLQNITSRGGDAGDEPAMVSREDEEEPSATSTEQRSALSSLEAARKRAAVALQQYEEEQRSELETIVRAEEDRPAVEGFESPAREESKKREHQLAAAGASVAHTIVSEAALFYAHIVVLVLSVVHLVWGWFKRRFGSVGVEEDDEDEYEE